MANWCNATCSGLVRQRRSSVLWCVLLLILLQPAVSGVGLVADFSSMLFRPANIFDRRKLRCVSRFISMAFDIRLLYDKDYNAFNIDRFFREDSVMTLAQAGDYVGRDDIREYNGFIEWMQTPFLSAGGENMGRDFQILGYNDETNQCEFLYTTNIAYTSDPETTSRETRFVVPLLTKMFLDYSDNYLTRFNLFYPTGFLNYMFGDILSNNVTHNFICNNVLTDECAASDVPVPTSIEECVTKLSSLPVADGANAYVDGLSQGCRALHSAFAFSNPINHCAHVAIDAIEDPKGRFRCQTSSETVISSLFEATELQAFEQFMIDNGIDTAVGFKELPLE